MLGEQVVMIAARVTAFTVVCESCAALEAAEWMGANFAGRLDLDLTHGTFLCRRGHSVRVERARPAYSSASAAA